MDRGLCGPQSQSVRGGEEKNSQPLPGLTWMKFTFMCHLD